MIVTFQELFDIVFMTVMLGLIFMYFFRGIRAKDALIAQYQSGFNMDEFKFSLMVIAPAIVLHELAHKFVALLFGMQATFHAAYLWLFIGLVLSMMRFKFLFFIPGFVSISAGSALQSSLTAGAGPFMNLLLWIGAIIVLKYKLVDEKYDSIIFLTKQINMFLFFFNMIPLGFFDGAKFFSGMIQYISTVL